MEIFALMSHFITCTPSLLEDIGILNVLFIAGYTKNHAAIKNICAFLLKFIPKTSPKK
jgi:hypothetical protein